MRRCFAAVFVALLLFGVDARAHRIDEYLQATLLTVEADRIVGSMRLIPGMAVAPAVIANIDTDADGVFSSAEQRAYAQRVVDDLSITIDGRVVRPRLVAWRFPSSSAMRDGLGEAQVDYAIDVREHAGDRTLVLTNHHLVDRSVHLVNVLAPTRPDLRIVAQRRNASQSVYALDYRQDAVAAAPPPTPSNDAGSWWPPVRPDGLFRLGMRHIAEGTDHLLFLLVLLLSAPSTVAGGRWVASSGAGRGVLRAAAIVTAFTIGHSITLLLAGVGGFDVPSRPVEVLIAASILVSAAHALRPLFPGREALVAAIFGLVHGLAFAATLDRLGLDRWGRVTGALRFNLGIEAMQLLVVILVLPSLLVLARTPAYRIVRIGGASFAAIASMAWLVERVWDVPTPVDAIVDGLANHAVALAALLAMAALVADLRARAAARRLERGLRRAGVAVAVAQPMRGT